MWFLGFKILEYAINFNSKIMLIKNLKGLASSFFVCFIPAHPLLWTGRIQKGHLWPNFSTLFCSHQAFSVVLDFAFIIHPIQKTIPYRTCLGVFSHGRYSLWIFSPSPLERVVHDPNHLSGTQIRSMSPLPCYFSMTILIYLSFYCQDILNDANITFLMMADDLFTIDVQLIKPALCELAFVGRSAPIQVPEQRLHWHDVGWVVGAVCCHYYYNRVTLETRINLFT